MFARLRPAFRIAAQALYDECRRRGWRPVVTSVYRSANKQRRLYRKYQRGQSPFPAAPPGESLHQFGLAFDMVVGEHQLEAGRLWESWGGKMVANDPVHFEARRG